MVWTNECWVSVTLVCWLGLGGSEQSDRSTRSLFEPSKEEDGLICFKDCFQPNDDDISIVG